MRFKLASMLVVGVLLGAAGPEGMQIQITDVGPLAQVGRFTRPAPGAHLPEHDVSGGPRA